MKNIILFSGGIDSATILYDLLKKMGKENIISVFFNYKQKNYANEKVAVKYITTLLDVAFMEINISDTFKYSNSSLIKHNTADITKKIIADNRTEYISKNTEIEFRNGVMVSSAISLAMQIYPKEKVTVYYGAAKTREPYPDCSLAFTEYMNLLSSYVSGGKVSVKAPLLNMGKDEIVAKAKALGVPIKKTWSCYGEAAEPCSICPACIDRKITGVF